MTENDKTKLHPDYFKDFWHQAEKEKRMWQERYINSLTTLNFRLVEVNKLHKVILKKNNTIKQLRAST